MISTLAPVPLSGVRLGFAPLDQEVRIDALPVNGTLPEWLTGTLVRNGPARFAVGAHAYRHWFDGLAMLHRFTIGAGTVSYANRFLRSPAFIEAERSGRIARSEFATDPRRGFFDWLGRPLGAGPSDNANVNVIPFGDEYLALTETPSPVAVDPDTLATLGVRAYDDAVVGALTTAHTLYDSERRATFNVVIEIGRTSTYKVVRIDDGTLRRAAVGTLTTDAPAYLHAFSMTQRYVVLVEYPLVVNPLALLFRRKPFIDNYRWKPGRGTRFHVIDKETGARTGSYDAPAFFAFHHVNAYEDADAIIVDISAYPDAGVIGDFMLERLLAAGPPKVARAALRRYRLVPGRSTAQIETITDAATELPRIAAARAGKPYTFAYGIDNAADGSDLFDRIVKVDVNERSVSSWSRPGLYPGEPVFVARPGSRDEDDGVLLAVVLDAQARSSFLVVVDARTLGEHARVPVPHHIPFGFHGMFR
jgi:carotenoid cleavage dioxygenase-like enzyme